MTEIPVDDREAVKSAATSVVDALRPLSGEERTAALASVWEHYCRHCGRDRAPGERPCQCWNDE